MARTKKSSLDVEEPIQVQDEMTVDEPTFEVGKAEEPAVEKKQETKAETHNETAAKKAKRGVKICVF
jgi:hypothetical protein